MFPLVIQQLPVLGFAIASLLAGAVQADHPSAGIGSELAGPINTITPETLPEGRWSASFRTEYISFDEISDAALSRFSEHGESVHSTGSLISSALSVAYGVTNNLTLAARLPYVKRKNLREAAHEHEEEHHEEEEAHAAEVEGVEQLGDSSGIGDAVLYGQYRFLNGDSGMHAATLFGVKLPTGDTDEKTRDGERFEAEHQPGSGSWDPMAGLAVSFPWQKTNIGASLLYALATEGSQDTDLGDGLFYSLSLSHRLGSGSLNKQASHHHDHSSHNHSGWDLMFELNGEWRDKVDVDGVDDGNTGGNVIFAAPGIRFTAPGGWAASLSAGIPVVENLNGIQSEPEWRVIGNIGFVF